MTEALDQERAMIQYKWIREAAMDQGENDGLMNLLKNRRIRKQAMDGWIKDKSNERWMIHAMDQEASDRSRSYRSSHDNVLLKFMSKNGSILKL